MSDELDTLTLAETARLLRLNIRTVGKMARQGKLPAMRIGGVWRVRRVSLDEWLRQRESAQAQDNQNPN